MVSVPGSSQMMGNLQMSGTASSGFGVALFGFYCANIEFGARLQELDAKEGPFTDLAQTEINGYTLLIAVKQDPLMFPEKAKIATYRREPHKFFQDLPRFIYSLKAQAIERISVSGSLGSIALTVLYRPAPIERPLHD